MLFCKQLIHQHWCQFEVTDLCDFTTCFVLGFLTILFVSKLKLKYKPSVGPSRDPSFHDIVIEYSHDSHCPDL
jgi:hypothetical protein